MSDEDALLAAIVANPDEDTPRLLYADWMDENPGPCLVLDCKMCVGGKQNDCEPGDLSYKEWDCQSCLGRGVITSPDTANSDRAEFIRVQVELSRRCETWLLKCREPVPSTDSPGNPRACGHCELCSLVARESALLVAHPEWRPVCPVCAGFGNVTLSSEPTMKCPACKAETRLGELRRGFLHRVNLPAIDYVIRDDEGGEWETTKWARHLVINYPTLQEVWIEGIQVRDHGLGPDVPTGPSGPLRYHFWDSDLPDCIQGEVGWHASQYEARLALAREIATALFKMTGGNGCHPGPTVPKGGVG